MRPTPTVFAALGPLACLFIRPGSIRVVPVFCAVGRRRVQTKDGGPPLSVLPKGEVVREGWTVKVSEKSDSPSSSVSLLRLCRTASRETKSGCVCRESGRVHSLTCQKAGRVKRAEGRAQSAWALPTGAPTSVVGRIVALANHEAALATTLPIPLFTLGQEGRSVPLLFIRAVRSIGTPIHVCRLPLPTTKTASVISASTTGTKAGKIPPINVESRFACTKDDLTRIACVREGTYLTLAF